MTGLNILSIVLFGDGVIRWHVFIQLLRYGTGAVNHPSPQPLPIVDGAKPTYSPHKKSAFTLAEGATHVVHFNDIRRVAFTLAEVLITLGIIGVVAALTMPALISNYKKTVYVNQLKKSVSVIENGWKMDY